MSRIPGYIIFAHGSSIETANEAVRALAHSFAQRIPGASVEPAFLELGKPDLDTAVDSLASRGVSEICVLPYFLTLGIHLQRDLPRLVEQASARHPGVSFQIAKPLHGHPALVEILLTRAGEASTTP